METLVPFYILKNGKSLATIDKLINDEGVVVDKQQITNPMNDHWCNIGNKLKLKKHQIVGVSTRIICFKE